LENFQTPQNTSGELWTLPVSLPAVACINSALCHLSLIIFQDFRKALDTPVSLPELRKKLWTPYLTIEHNYVNNYQKQNECFSLLIRMFSGHFLNGVEIPQTHSRNVLKTLFGHY
jgi:hypothetical protein